MKKLFLFGLMSLMALQVQAQGQAKKYAIKSGKLVLALSGSVTGSRTIYFDDYGSKYFEEEKSVTEIKMFGATDRTETHKITIMNKDQYWVIDKIEGTNMKGSLPLYERGQDYAESFTQAEREQMADEVLTSMGGQKLGEEEVLGFDCEKMSLMGSMVWIYEGIALKSEVNVMGIVSHEIATEFDEGVLVSSSIFHPPGDVKFTDMQAQQTAAYGQMEMSMDQAYEQEDIIPVSLPFKEFQAAMDHFNPSGYARTMVMSQEGQHIAIYNQGITTIISVAATSMKNMEEDEEYFRDFESFKHHGRDMLYGVLKDDGLTGKALLITYDEYEMYIILLAVPGKDKAGMLAWADELEF